MFKSNRGGGNYIDWSKVDRAPVEVIAAIKGNLPYIISQMPYSEQMELLGNYHMKTSDFDTMKNDIKEALSKDSKEGNVTLADVVGELQSLSSVINVIKTKQPKWFK